MKIIKASRLIALLLAFLMISVNVFDCGTIPAFADGREFFDDFSNASLNGWKNADVGNVKSGSYCISGSEYNVISAVGKKEKIQITADVTVNIGADSSGIMQNSIAALVVCADEQFKKGYEFGIGVTKTGTTYARLYLRGDEKISKILVQKSSEDLTDINIKTGTSYELSVGVFEGTINCFINGKPIISYSDNTYNSGFCGIKTSWSKSVFDNVSVRKIGKKVISSLTLNNTPQTVSVLGELDFTATLSYTDAFHNTETVGSDDPRLKISGFGRTPGKKSITVSCGNKSAAFKVNVVKSSGETVIFSDDFTNFSTDNYTFYNTIKDDYGIKYGQTASNGKLIAKTPNVASTGYNGPLVAKSTLNTEYTKNIGETYSFSADASINSEVSGTATKRSTFAEISCFADSYGKVYKFRLISTGNFQLYRDDELLMSKSLSSVLGTSFEFSKFYNLKMTVSENIILCFANDKNVFSYTGAKMDKMTSKSYVSANNGSVDFDNLKLIKNEKCSKNAAKSVKIYSVADGNPVSSYIGKSLDISKLYLAVTYIDSSIRNVGLTEEMITGYDDTLKGNQKVTVTYGAAKSTFNFTYSEYLFYDSFDDGISPNWNVTSCANTELSIKNNRLKSTWNGTNSEASISMSANTEGSDKWRNYSVSADISFDTTMTKMIRSGQMVSIFFRRTGSNYYDLRLVTRGGTVSLNLYKYVSGQNTLVNSVTTGQINAKFGGTKTASNGTLFSVKAICKDSTIYIYLDGILFMIYNDTAEDAPYSGYAGMKIAKVTGSVDNFTVQEKGPFNIDRIQIEGLKDNTFEIYEGFEINPYDYKINCIDADGTVFVESLTSDMLSDYDNLSVGSQNITITAYGKKQSAKVVVKNRDDYINKLDEELKELNPKKLKLSDKDKVYDLQNRYDELSSYEITKLSDKAFENMKTARENMEILVYPELKNSKIIYSNDFNDSKKFDESEWFDGVEKGRGEWKVINGAYRVEQERYNISSTSLRIVKPIYAKLDSVSARMMMLSEAMYMGFAFNIGDDGYYIARVKMDAFDDKGKVNPILQFIKDDVRVFNEPLSGYGLDIKENEWFTMNVTFIDNMIKVYVNDKLVISFDDSESSNYYTEGRTGIRLHNGNAKFDNFVMRGTVLEEPATKATVTPTKYEDDFEDEKVNSDPSHFVEEDDKNNWQIYSSANNKYYGTKYTADYTYTWLHVFESDPKITLDFMTDKKGSDGKFGFFIRMSPETAYLQIGYDCSKKQWFAVDTKNERDCDVNTVYSEKTSEIEPNKWYKLSIAASGTDVTVKLDGKEVLTLKKVSQTTYGRVGAFADGTSLYFDNIKCEFPNGGEVQDGILEYTVRKGVYTGTAEVESLDGDKVILAGYNYVGLSKDNGKSFEELSEEDPYYEAFCGYEGYNSCMQLHDGSYIFTRKNDFIIRKSKDYGKTWEEVGRIFAPEEMLDDLDRAYHSIHINSFTEYQLKDGTWRIFLCVIDNLYKSTLTTSSSSHYTRVFYSDDGGVTWKESECDSRDVSTTWNPDDVTSADWAECKIVQCDDGTLRMYLSRDSYGCLQYTVSKDGGVTWEGQYQIPEMQCAKASFNVIEDPSDRGTYYLIWVNNNPVIKGSNFSRSRLSLARSTDGKNWTFLCDIERMAEEVYGNDMDSTTPLFQCIDPCIEVTDKYVFVTFGRSDGTDPTKITGSSTNYHQGLRLRVVRIEKEKLQDTEWNNYSISDMLFPKSIEVTKPIKVRYGVGEIFGFSGGIATVTALDGSKKEIDTGRLRLVEEPDLFTLGKQTVTLFDSHCIKTSYEIEVVPKYNINWTVLGNGEVEPQDTGILEGDTLSVKLKPKNIFVKVKSVRINGKTEFAFFGKIIRENVKEDLDIEVIFTARGFLDYFVLILLLAIITEAVFLAVVSAKKKTKYFAPLKKQLEFLKSLFLKLFKRSKKNG